MERDESHCKRDAEKPRLTVHSDDNEEYYRHEHSPEKEDENHEDEVSR